MRNSLDLVLEFPGEPIQRTIGCIARQNDHHNGKQAEVDFVDFRVIRRHRQIPFGKINALTDIRQRSVSIKARIKLKQHVGAAFITRRAQFLNAFNRLEFLLHGSDQQALGILGRDTIVTHRHINDRNINVRLGLLGDILISDRPGYQNKKQNGQYRSRIPKSGADE